MKRPPIVKGDTPYYPKGRLCPWCHKRKVREPNSMAILSGGALSRKDEDTYSAPTEGLRAFMSVNWHGAHDGGEGDHPETGLYFDIAQDVEGGLFNIMFCSVDCLRAFLNDCLDKFEQRVNRLKPLG